MHNNIATVCYYFRKIPPIHCAVYYASPACGNVAQPCLDRSRADDPTTWYMESI